MHSYEGRFLKGTNYKMAFIREVDRLLVLVMELPERMKAIDILLEAYVMQVGEVPDSTQITRLADLILREDLKNRHPDKITNTDYPFLSGGQLRLRNRREIPCNLTGATDDLKYKMNGRKKTSYNKQG